MSLPPSIFVLTWRSGNETVLSIKAPVFDFGRQLFFFFSSFDVFFFYLYLQPSLVIVDLFLYRA